MKYNLRRVDKEITDERILKKILKSTKYVTLALSMDNQPYLVYLAMATMKIITTYISTALKRAKNWIT